MKKAVAITHQLGGRDTYFPIHSPTANASVAQRMGSCAGFRFVDVEPGPTPQVGRREFPALHDAWADEVAAWSGGKIRGSQPA